MQVAICNRYGLDHDLQILEKEKPVPQKNEVLVRVVASTVTTGDWRIRTLNMPRGFSLMARLIFGFSKPRLAILGTEVSGVVETVGVSVTRFKPGDAVIAVSGAKFGCHVEYRCFPEEGMIVLKPDFLSFEQAACLSFGGLTALGYLKEKAKLQAGEKVLVYGASGSVGLAAVQVAKQLGAQVTGVCSLGNHELVKAHGASHVIDYTREDFMKKEEKYDVIIDTVGTLGFSKCKSNLNPRGRLLLVSSGLDELLKMSWINLTSSKKLFAGPILDSCDRLQDLVAMVKPESCLPVIDRVYSFAQINDAYRYVAERHKKGNVVIKMVD